MAWVYMALEGGEPVAFADDPDVVAQQEAKGYEVVDDVALTAGAPDVPEPDEVDIHGQGWIYLEHPEVGGPARYPVEVADEMYAQGWTRPQAEQEEAAEEAEPEVEEAPVEPEETEEQ